MPAPRRRQHSPQTQRRINHGSAIIVPLLVIGFAVYVTWVNVDIVCYRYLLHPDQYFPRRDVPKRTGAAIAILVLHFVLFVLFLLCYARIFYTIATNPGYIGPDPDKKPRRDMEQTTQSSSFDRHAILTGAASLPPGAEAFWSKSAFICDPAGLPNYCTECDVYKPDRSHHSSDVGRCTARMDHFCPWVGGMVCKRNFKFFYQFLVYACFFSVFVLAVMAYTFADQRHRAGDSNGHVIAGIAIGAMFVLFTTGMVGNTGYLISSGLTTVENLDRFRRVYYIAVLMPPSASFVGPTITYPLSSPAQEESRKFAIMETPHGARPWHLGPLKNWKDLMGHSLLDWLLPLRYSPFCSRDTTSTEYEFGPVLEQMKRSAGILDDIPQR